MTLLLTVVATDGAVFIDGFDTVSVYFPKVFLLLLEKPLWVKSGFAGSSHVHFLRTFS